MFTIRSLQLHTHIVFLLGVALFMGSGVALVGEVAAQPKGQMVFALDFSIAPTWFEPAETAAITTPFLFLYALHDALLKPLPGNAMAPALAESWEESADGLSYEFKLREGLAFHNGDPFTAEDVKFSFERYRGANAAQFRERVNSVEVVGPHRVRFHLTEPWPDFLAYYGTPSTGAAWVVPKRSRGGRNPSLVPFLQAARPHVQGYTQLHGFKIQFETTGLEK